MNKYNMVINVNSDYFAFAKIFFRSFFDNVDIKNLNKFYVFDCGLLEEEREWLSMFPFVELKDTDLEYVKTNEVHGKEWSAITYTKITNAKKILEQDNLPVFIFDVDSVFVQGFEDIIDFSNDVVCCRVRDDRLSQCPSSYIGSFVGFLNVQKSINFIDTWHNLIINSNDIKTAWRESPALSILVNENRSSGQYKIQEIKESIICSTLFSPKNTENVVNVHMKSEKGMGYSTTEERLRMPHVIGYIEKYV